VKNGEDAACDDDTVYCWNDLIINRPRTKIL
jgi:hypothetical protein